MISRDAVVDVLLRDDEAIVLTAGQCLRLSALAAAIVGFVEVPRSEEELSAHLRERFGPPPEDRLALVLRELAEQQVIRITPRSAPSD